MAQTWPENGLINSIFENIHLFGMQDFSVTIRAYHAFRSNDNVDIAKTMIESVKSVLQL